MTRQSLAAAASLLYGAQWQRPLSKALEIDNRLVRRWWAGDRPIPEWVRSRLIEALQERIKSIEEEIERLKSEDDVFGT